MIDGIRQNLTHLEPGSRKGAKAQAGDAVASPRVAVPEPSTVLSSALIGLALANSGGVAPLDRTRIEAIRDAIRKNEYPVDFDQLAERMLDVDFYKRGDQAF
jgi:anti-sigma28 factor (negative regulator of flagellin synthesis)